MPRSLVLERAHGPLSRFVLAGEACILGRAQDCDFVVTVNTISRRHARLVRYPEGFVVQDLRSRNGTFVDGERVESAHLRDGQVVRFGSVPFRVCFQEPEVALAQPEEGTASFQAAVSTPLSTSPPIELLSDSQRRVFDLLLTGEPQKIIARRLALSQHTVHNHIRAIYRALHVHSRAELQARFASDTTQS
jgi:DNA-binding CsgD family transcriptional regulator